MTRKYPKTTEVHELTHSEKSALEHESEMDHQMVEGVFKNYQQANNPIRFPYRKYAKDPIKWYPEDVNGRQQYFRDGQKYRIPLMVANHLNNNCWRPVNRNQQDSNGKPIPEVMMDTQKHRFGFINTDFRPVSGWKEPSALVQVNKTII